MIDRDPDDGLPLDDGGPWAADKHARLNRFIDIAHGVRRKFIAGPSRTATYVDMFSGAGRARVRYGRDHRRQSAGRLSRGGRHQPR